MSYQHTQHGPLGWLLLIVAIGPAILSAVVVAPSPVAIVLGVVAGVFVALAACFGSLTVTDRGDRLSIRYGPLPLFGSSVVYSTITQLRIGRSALIDGWGIHYIPGRGWTYNLWGRDCVEIQMASSKLRIGTDDASRLCDFLRSKLNAPSAIVACHDGV
jgi:hypothetical protein